MRTATLLFLTTILFAPEVFADNRFAHVRREKDTFPTFQAISKLVVDHFKQKRYEPTTLISRGDVEPLFGEIEKLGWKVKDQKEILAEVLADNDFMVQQLRRPDGHVFAEEVSHYPDGYDRTDRLRRLPRGEIFLNDLVGNPGGYKLIEYMTTSPYGYNMGEMLSETPDGRNFNKPTSRLYTYEQFLKQLGSSYRRAEQERKSLEKTQG